MMIIKKTFKIVEIKCWFEKKIKYIARSKSKGKEKYY